MKPEAFLNVMARIAGFWFTLIGFGFGAWSLYFVLHPDDPRRITPDGSDGLVMNTQVTVIAVLIGAALLSVRTYRPDLGDSRSLCGANGPARAARGPLRMGGGGGRGVLVVEKGDEAALGEAPSG